MAAGRDMPVRDRSVRPAGRHAQQRRPDRSARLRTWFANNGREALQGAGSIKRDCLLWETWLQSRGVPYKAIKPAAGATKWDAAKFQRITGWTKRTNEHARDAALLCFGVK